MLQEKKNKKTLLCPVLHNTDIYQIKYEKISKDFSYIHYCSRLSMFSTAKVFIWCVLFPCVPNETLNISFKQINTSYQVLSLSLSWTKWCSYWFSFDRNSPHVHSCECYLGTMMKSSQILFWRFLYRRFFHVCERMWWQLKIIKDCLHRWRVYLRRDSFHVVKGNGEVKGFFFYNTTYTSGKFL